MNIEKIKEIISGQLICESKDKAFIIEHAFASDLMSDVLALDNEVNNVALVTGLINTQTIRTAEMADIKLIIVCRNKVISHDMRDLAQDNDITVIECPYSMFKTSALLYNSGIQAIY